MTTFSLEDLTFSLISQRFRGIWPSPRGGQIIAGTDCPNRVQWSAGGRLLGHHRTSSARQRRAGKPLAPETLGNVMTVRSSGHDQHTWPDPLPVVAPPRLTKITSGHVHGGRNAD